MDTSASAEVSKKQKLFEQQCNDGIDRISNLPEHILHYILSFLPTKYAVGTSVLSTRWNGLWKFIHNLDFCDEHLYNTSSKRPNYWKRKELFNEFVHKVLRHNDVSNLQKWSLKCRHCDAGHFYEWISTILRCKVQELSISVSMECPFRFSDCLFTSKSLRILKINMRAASINIPASVCLSSLEVLHLKNISFVCDQPIQEISISCPVLEKLILNNCVWPKIKNVTISAPILQTLEIEVWSSDDLNDCEIRIYAESLVLLKFRGYLSYQKYSLCHLSSLVDVSIELSSFESAHRVESLLRQIANVKSLELSRSSIKVLSHPDLSNHLLALSRLIHLTVGYRIEANGRAFIDLLCSMPNIKSVFILGGLGSIRFKGQGRIMGTTPKCFLSQLKLVDIRHFRCIKEEKWFVKFLIKSARVVDKLTIKLSTNGCFDSRYPGELPERDIKELQLLASKTNCVLEFPNTFKA